MVDHAETGGALIAGSLTAPLVEDPGLDTLAVPDEPEAPPVVREPIGVEALAERIGAAARRSAEIGRPVDYELGLALPLLARALTGRSDGLAALEALPPAGPLDVDPEHRAAFDTVAEELLMAFEQWLGEDTSDRTLAAADEGLEFKFAYGDGRLGEWLQDDLEAFLLDYVPARGTQHPADAEALPDDLLAFLRFLSEGDLLDGDPLEALEAAVDDLRAPYAETFDDPRRFGPAKTLIMQMRADGVDLTDQAAMQRWSEDFNARPFAERDRLLGPALGGGPTGPSRGGSATPAKRKAAKQARRRNRR